MTIIYEYKNEYYTFKNGKYYKCNVMVKPNTIVVVEDGTNGVDIVPEKEYTFMELKNKLVK